MCNERFFHCFDAATVKAPSPPAETGVKDGQERLVSRPLTLDWSRGREEVRQVELKVEF